MMILALSLLIALSSTLTFSASVPRSVRISGRDFVDAKTGLPLVLSGPNVVVKGPPYLPSVEGSTECNDIVNDECSANGNCTSCETFNSADVANLRNRGWNSIRLGVVWAGAQPLNGDALDAAFLVRLHALLNLTDAANVNVVLDNHGDMVGGASCGNGAPLWFQQQAARDLIGLPLTTGFPYNLVPGLQITELGGYQVCGSNASRWAAFSGDINYNIMNECCQAMNSGGNPGALGFTTISQATMDYLVTEGPGRDAFVNFWRLMAEAVSNHPSAIACELMNEPMTIRRTRAFDTWRAAGLAISAVIPDMSISVMDIGEAILIPNWVVDIVGGSELISNDTMAWIREAGNVFLAWHWYGQPANVTQAAQDALALSASWGIPSFATEFGDCSAWVATAQANISHLFWHYSSYCTTGPAFGNRHAPADTFGACILGWAGGSSSGVCGPSRRV